MYLSTAHLQHLQTQPQNEQNVELERKLRRQKEMLEQMLNQKVKIALLRAICDSCCFVSFIWQQ
jgi:hypothetical protein